MASVDIGFIAQHFLVLNNIWCFSTL